MTADLGVFCADTNIRTRLIDLDTQPSLSSFYRLESEAPGGTYPLISQNEAMPNLSLILSNDQNSWWPPSP